MFKRPKPTLYLRDTVLWYSFRFKGKRYRGTTKTSDPEKALKIAEDVARITIRRMTSDGFLPEELTASMLFERYHERLAEKQRHVGTIKNYVEYSRRFIEFFGDCLLAELSRYQMEDWTAWLLAQPTRSKGRDNVLSEKTVREHLGWLSAVYRYFDLPNPVSRIEYPRKSQAERQEEFRFYTEEEMRELMKTADLLAAFQGTLATIRHHESRGKPISPSQRKALARTQKKLNGYKPLPQHTTWQDFNQWLRLLANTGIRRGEGQILRFRDIDWEKRIIWVTSSKTKSRRPLKLDGEGGIGDNLPN